MITDHGNPVRVLMLNYEYPPIGGGAANATEYVLREMTKTGRVTVDLVTSGVGKGDRIDQTRPGLRIHYLDVRKKNLHYWTQREIITWFLRARRYAHTLVSRETFDCCHAWFGFPAGLVARLVCRNRMPYIVSLRGSDVPGFNERFSVHYHLLRPIFRHVWRSASAVVANSEGLRGLALETEPGSDIDVVPNGIDIDEFSPAAIEPPGPFRVLCVSRLISRKAIDQLIRAFVSVNVMFPDAELVIAGDGVEAKPLRKLATAFGLRDAVRFEGRRSHETMAELYRTAHLFVLPSRWEGMSNAMLEAMATGLPVVATETGGTSELVRDNGIVVPPDNVEKLSEAMVSMLSDGPRRLAAGAASRTIAESFSWSAVADRYLDAYSAAAGGPCEMESSAIAAVARP
jgi:glycosyltransferase involved in cell wall biosynthesis